MSSWCCSEAFPSLPVHTIVAASGVVLAAIYMLWAYERAFTGVPDKPENQKLVDLSVPGDRDPGAAVLLMLVLGLYPKVLLDRIEPSTEAVLDRIEAVTDYRVPAPGRIDQVLAEGGE